MNTYSSIFHVGHRGLGADFMTLPLYVQEKVDGSQLSFQRTATNELLVRSRGQEFSIDAPPTMFKLACLTIQRIADKLTPGWVYRGEYLNKPKHNTLAYDRTPSGGIILFDIAVDEQENYLGPNEVYLEALRLGLETVPMLGVFQQGISSLLVLDEFLKRESVLGGQKIEGVVIKQLPGDGRAMRFDYQSKKLVVAKYVSEAFKEIHGKEWKKSNPQGGDILEQLSARYRTEARWNKAIQRLRDEERLTGTVKDIGPFIHAIQADLDKEVREDASDILLAWAWPHIQRGGVKGAAEYFKTQLASGAFGARTGHVWVEPEGATPDWPGNPVRTVTGTNEVGEAVWPVDISTEGGV